MAHPLRKVRGNDMKYGVFGGTFDPFTVAHYAIVREILRKRLVDKVIVLPTIVDWYRKDKDRWLGASDKSRIIGNALRDEATVLGSFEWSDVNKLLGRSPNVTTKDVESCNTDIIVDFSEFLYEFERSDESYVRNRRYVNMLSDVINRYGVDNEYFTIIGSDSYVNFPTWSRYKAITGMGKLIVVDGRNGQTLPDDVKTDPNVCAIVEIDKKYSGVSASKIREKYKERWRTGIVEYISELKKQIDCYGDRKYLHTPIFDVFERENDGYGFNPVAVNAPDWVAVCAEKDGKYLLTKQLRFGTMTEVEEFPCGCVEEGEDPSVAASRELAEETGYVVDPKNLTSLGKVASNPGFMTNFMHYFYVNLDKVPFEKKEQQLDEHEKLTAYWKEIETFKKDFETSEVRPVFVLGMLDLVQNKI